MTDPSTSEAIWQSMLTDHDSPLRRNRRLMKMLPSSHRCKVCNAPLAGATGAVLRLRGVRPAKMNPRFCSLCEGMAEKHPGGAEIELTLLFADIRGSTGLAESLGTAAFTRLVGRFYDAVTRVLIGSDAFIDRLIGDEVIALFIPLLVGPDYTTKAVDAARRILADTGHGTPEGPWVAVGAGVHTGTAFVGSVGSSGVTDFTALGDDVNATARLASAAGPGEILVSGPTAVAAGLDTAILEPRRLELKGRQQPMDVYVLGANGA